MVLHFEYLGNMPGCGFIDVLQASNNLFRKVLFFFCELNCGQVNGANFGMDEL